jgi:chromosomal replication initiator protein
MDINVLWKSVLAEIELSVSKPTYQTQFAQTSLLSLEKGVATVGVVNPLLRTMIETRYYSLIKSFLDARTKTNTSIVFVVIPKKEKEGVVEGPLFSSLPAVEIARDTASYAKKLHIRPESTFEKFAVSGSNQIAYAAATAVAKDPGSAYNPLFIYGGVGVGKTHLMHAVANALLEKKPGTKIVYCMGEEFLNEIVEAIQTKTARQFKQKYRSAQLLLVDDVQFIAGKLTAQEEFFHTFNAVHREGGQIILTSDRPPADISRLEDRLRSRFEGGLIVDVSPPDFELRAAIVNIKSQNMGVSIPPDAAQMIAANTTDTRAIEGVLRRIKTEVAAAKQPVSLETVKAALRGRGGTSGPTNEPKPTKRVTSQDILEGVARHFDIKSSTIKGPKRDRPIVRPRQIIMYLCKGELGMTLDDIGGLLGGRDHTTIMHGVEIITNELSTNPHLREDVERIKSSLWNS